MAKLKLRHPLLLIVFLTLFVVPAFALPVLTISSPGGDGVFVLRGEQMDGVAGLDLSVGYDPETMGNPRVSMGIMARGMMSAANPGNPVRMAIVGTRALSGSGTIATIAFDRTGDSPGVITILAGTLIDAGGRKIAMGNTVIVNPAVAAATPASSGKDAEDGASGPDADSGQGGASGQGRTSAGGVPGETTGLNVTISDPLTVGETAPTRGREAAPERKDASGGDPVAVRRALGKKRPVRKAQMDGEEAPPEREDNPPPEETPAPEPTPPPQATQPVVIPSVLARFREFHGERNVANLTSLFRQEHPVPYTQIPPVALADGASTVTLIVGMDLGGATPSFTLSGCSYVSHKHTERGWEIEARPERGAVEAGITVLYGGLRQVFPLVVAPKVSLVKWGQRRPTEADFQHFLDDRGTAGAPHFDLNKDGRRDYVDDYIYTVNYLAQSGVPGI